MPERVWKVRVDQPLMAAFTLIKEKDISAVPVVDEFGVIKGGWKEKKLNNKKKTFASLSFPHVHLSYNLFLIQPFLILALCLSLSFFSPPCPMDAGNISARDVRLIITSPKVYKLLHMPISVYLEVVSEGEFETRTCPCSANLPCLAIALSVCRRRREFGHHMQAD
jgi:CBS domain-containing protein